MWYLRLEHLPKMAAFSVLSLLKIRLWPDLCSNREVEFFSCPEIGILKQRCITKTDNYFSFIVEFMVRLVLRISPFYCIKLKKRKTRCLTIKRMANSPPFWKKKLCSFQYYIYFVMMSVGEGGVNVVSFSLCHSLAILLYNLFYVINLPFTCHFILCHEKISPFFFSRSFLMRYQTTWSCASL